MSPKEGSSAVEAAFVFPLIVLIVAAFITAGSQIYSRVRASAEEHYEKALDIADGGGIEAEEVMRIRRYFR